MELIPHIHLEDWNISKNIDHSMISYEKGKIKILEDVKNKKFDLYIQSSDNNFRHIKRTDNYWEVMSFNIFLNGDIIDDSDNMEFQLDLMNNIRDDFSKFETMIFNKKTGHVFGVNNLIDNNGWNDKLLEIMWSNDEIVILDLLEDIDPKLLTKNGWEDINVNYVGEDINEIRNRHIEELL